MKNIKNGDCFLLMQGNCSQKGARVVVQGFPLHSQLGRKDSITSEIRPWLVLENPQGGSMISTSSGVLFSLW